MSLGYHCETGIGNKMTKPLGLRTRLRFPLFSSITEKDLVGGGDKLRISQAHGSNRTPVFSVCPIIDYHPFLGSDSAKHPSDKDMYQ